MSANRYYVDHPNDTVAIALRDLPQGETLDFGLELVERIPFKHKFALRDLGRGQQVIMCGIPVGRTTSTVAAGALLNTANLVHDTAGYSQERHSSIPRWIAPDVSALKDKTFNGYHREDGRVGTANHWLVIPLVFCENRNVEVLREAVNSVLRPARFNPYAHYAQTLASLSRKRIPVEDWPDVCLQETREGEVPLFPNVDGVKFLTHAQGCGGTRQDAKTLCGLLAGYISHPNVGGVTILSLGCQNAEVKILEDELAERCPEYNRPFSVFEQQRSTSEPQMIGSALASVFRGLNQINESERKPAQLGKLVIGLECGGSDGLSGVTANPCLGRVVDRLVAVGGSAILSEFPELCGVEQDIINRCVSDKLTNRFCSLMERYASVANIAGSGFDMNPSPGNISDGLITDAMKSAGAARKGGTSPVVDVLDYPEQAKVPGLSLLCTPGGDVESTTAMVGAGANVVLFTTGLGTPTGNPIAPTIKVSSNTELFNRMPDLIDFDAGRSLSGESDPDQLAEELLSLTIDVASGVHTPNAVRLDQNDFIPWKRGPSL
ncbi:MAG: UxaA family hydrolase [Puniceicoccaceae bacterium]